MNDWNMIYLVYFCFEIIIRSFITNEFLILFSICNFSET